MEMMGKPKPPRTCVLAPTVALACCVRAGLQSNAAAAARRFVLTDCIEDTPSVITTHGGGGLCFPVAWLITALHAYGIIVLCLLFF